MTYTRTTLTRFKSTKYKRTAFQKKDIQKKTAEEQSYQNKPIGTPFNRTTFKRTKKWTITTKYELNLKYQPCMNIDRRRQDERDQDRGRMWPLQEGPPKNWGSKVRNRSSPIPAWGLWLGPRSRRESRSGTSRASLLKAGKPFWCFYVWQFNEKSLQKQS